MGFVKDQMDLESGSRVGSFSASQRAFGQLHTDDDAVASSNTHVKLESDVLCSPETFKKDACVSLNGAGGLKSSSQDSSDKSLVSKKRKSKIDKKLAAA